MVVNVDSNVPEFKPQEYLNLAKLLRGALFMKGLEEREKYPGQRMMTGLDILSQDPDYLKGLRSISDFLGYRDYMTDIRGLDPHFLPLAEDFEDEDDFLSWKVGVLSILQ
jgi:hypothetical protein